MFVRSSSRISATRGSRGRKPADQPQKFYNNFSMLWKWRRLRPGVTCKSPRAPSREGPSERWPSGLRRTLGKRVCGKPYRGFESHSLRHVTVLFCIRLSESTAKPASSATNAFVASFAMLPEITANAVFNRGFGGGFFRHRTVLLCIPLFEATAKTTSSAIKPVAASSAMLPLVTAQTVASGREFGGCISRGRPHGRQAQAARRRTQNSVR
jgi:hypothetical protein